MNVLNLQGQIESFSSNKVFLSAKRSGASPTLARQIAKNIESQLFDGIKTSDIYKMVKQGLNKQDKSSGYRFTLKQAIKDLGPSGFPFEKYVADIYRAHGYDVKTNLKIKGQYATHELDFIARKGNEILVGECKFRKSSSDNIDLKTVLRVHARCIDLRGGHYFKGNKISPIIVTNSRFSTQVVRYANGHGIALLGWRFPREGGLEKLIEDEKLYPITILPSFRKGLMDDFSRENIMLASDVMDDIAVVDKKTLEKLRKEAQLLI